MIALRSLIRVQVLTRGFDYRIRVGIRNGIGLRGIVAWLFERGIPVARFCVRDPHRRREERRWYGNVLIHSLKTHP